MKHERIMHVAIRLAAISILMLIAGCTQRIEFTFPSKGIVKVEAFDGGRPIASCDVSVESDAMRRFSAWLTTHRDGWQPTLVTYAPKIHIRGSGFDINFLSDGVVINFDRKQYIRTVSDFDTKILLCNRRS